MSRNDHSELFNLNGKHHYSKGILQSKLIIRYIGVDNLVNDRYDLLIGVFIQIPGSYNQM